MVPFDRYLTSILEAAAHEARDDGSATVEAHHLLLAIATDREPTTDDLLASAGLDRAGVREALDREFEHSLSAAGVTLAGGGLPRASGVPADSPKLGTSGRLAIERAFASVSRKRDLRPAHLLLGIVQAPVGTVPRALALGGVDRSELAERIRRAVPTEAA